MSTNEQPAASRSDPDNVFISVGQKDPSKSYVFVPFSYRDAHAALKEAGARFMGSQWEIDRKALEAAEPGIREAARRDIALGVEGRKARELEMKAARESAAEQKAGRSGADADADKEVAYASFEAPAVEAAMENDGPSM